MSEHEHLDTPRALRWVFVALGLVCLGLGGVGVVVPGLPTTIFLILASYFFTRSCPPLDRWMRSARLFKPYARYLDRRTPMPIHAVVLTVAMIWIAIAFSTLQLWSAVSPVWLVSSAGVLGGIASFSVIWWGRITILRELEAEESRSNPDPEATAVLKWTDVMGFARDGNPTPTRRVERSQAEWQEVLTPEQFRVLRLHGTERAFSSEMCSRFEPGRYACAGCGTLLFDADEKFESGTGWPSFTQPADRGAISYRLDTSFGMTRVETLCSTCDGHLGHVFPDGPPPSGLRYCINAVALEKVEDTA